MLQISRADRGRSYVFLSSLPLSIGFGSFWCLMIWPPPRGQANMTFETMNGHRGNGRECSKKVLIVEDNDLNMKLFNDLLEAHGYNTLQTRDGVEALQMAREHRPDLILMDIQLPEVSGLEVTKWIKEDEELRSIPVIAVTA